MSGVTLKEFMTEQMVHLKEFHEEQNKNILNRLDKIVERQDIANGRSVKHEECIKEIENDIQFIRWLKKHPFKAVIAVVVVFSVLYIILDAFGAMVVLKWFGYDI